MFNNRFNSTHKDPLVEAVRQAQEDGELRRQAIAYVNEQFGVYSRNAVVREDLEGYDISVDTAYQELKEGNKENKEKKKEHEEKTGMEHIKKMGGFPGQSLKRTARSLTKEEKADKDYDKDGKIESPKDEVWGSRFRAAKKAGKMEEGAVDAGSYEGSKSVTKSAPKEDPSLPKSYPGAASSAPTAARLSNAKAAVSPIKEDEQLDELYGKGSLPHIAAYHTKKSAESKGQMEKTRSGNTKLPVPKKVTDKVYAKDSAAKYHAHQAKRAKGMMEEESLDEVSKGRAISAYRQKEGEERDTSKLHGLIKRKWGKETAKHAERAGAQDTVGLVRRGEDRGKEDSIARDRRYPRDRMTKSGKVHKQDTATLKGNIKRRLGSHTKPGHLPEEQIDELSHQTLRNYLGATRDDPTRSSDNRELASSKILGMGKAKVPAASPESGIPMNEAAYSAKSARAGKDIGKKGKMFAKIAAKAGETYGSEERGQKVAGKILQRIRSKHVKEENIEELAGFSAAFAAARKAGKSTFEMGGKSYTTALKGQSPSSTGAARTSTPGTQGVATGKNFAAIDKAQAQKAKSGPADNPGLRGSTMPKTPGTVARDTGITGKPGGETGVRSGSTVSLDRPGNPGASTNAAPAPTPKPNAPSTPAPSSTPSSAKPSSSSGLVGPDAGKMMTANRSAPTTSQPGAPKDDASAGVKKVMATMNEEVQIGDYKYRII